MQHARSVSRALLLLVAATAVALSAAATARADDFKLGEDPVSVIMKWRPTTPDPEVPGFVRESRPDAALEYKPVGGRPVERPKLKTKAELAATAKGLDDKADALRRRGGVASRVSSSTAQQLQAAGAESRRRAAQDFGSGTSAAK